MASTLCPGKTRVTQYKRGRRRKGYRIVRAPPTDISSLLQQQEPQSLATRAGSNIIAVGDTGIAAANYESSLIASNSIVYHNYGWFVLPDADWKRNGSLDRKKYYFVRYIQENQQLFCNCEKVNCIHTRIVQTHGAAAVERRNREFVQADATASVPFSSLSVSSSASSSSSSASSSSSSSTSSPLSSSLFSSCVSGSSSPICPITLIPIPHQAVLHLVMDEDYYILNAFSVVCDEVDTAPVVVLQRQDLYKFSCSRHKKRSCHHVALVRAFCGLSDSVQLGLEGNRVEEGESIIPVSAPVSQHPIPVPMVFRGPDDIAYHSGELENIPSHLCEPYCSSCRQPYIPTNTAIEQVIDVIVYSSKRATRCQLGRWRCTCKQLVPFDGLYFHLFFYSVDRLFTHELLNQFTIRFSRSETTFSSFWYGIWATYHEVAESDAIRSQLSSVYTSNSSPLSLPFVSPPTFRHVWFSFIRLQKWKYTFCCPSCGPHPQTVLADGITLSLPRQYLTGLQLPTSVNEKSSVQIRSALGADARFLRSAPLLTLVRRFTGRLWARDNWTAKQDLEDGEYEIMVAGLKREKMVEMKEVCDVVRELRSHPLLVGNEFIQKTARWYARLLRILASKEPLLSFIPSGTINLITSTVTTLRNRLLVSPMDLTVLQNYNPFVLEMLKFFHSNSQPISLTVCDLLLAACKRAEKIAKKLQKRVGQQPVPEQFEEQQLPIETTGSFYGMPQIRTRPKYIPLDTTNDAENEDMCDKQFSQFNGISGGCMVLWCPHRIALGFHIIPKGEGRNDVFSAIFTHWPVAPKLVVYDFACQLQPYCLAREPEYFKDTIFLIDRLHSNNHVSCSEVFDLEAHRVSGSRMFYINDEVQEQGNLELKPVRKSCLYMKRCTFMPFVQLKLETSNRKQIKRLKRKGRI